MARRLPRTSKDTSKLTCPAARMTPRQVMFRMMRIDRGLFRFRGSNGTPAQKVFNLERPAVAVLDAQNFFGGAPLELAGLRSSGVATIRKPDEAEHDSGLKLNGVTG